MADPHSDDTIRVHRRNGNGSPGNGAPADRASLPEHHETSKALPAFFGTFGALMLFAILCALAYFGYQAFKPSPASASTPAESGPVAKTDGTVKASSKSPLNDASTWQLSQEPAQNLTGDGQADIGWWVRTFDLPGSGTVLTYFKNQGVTVSNVVPLHYDDTKDATTITYQVQAQVPEQLLHVQKASWAPSDPDLKPFATLLVLNQGLPVGQFWNTQTQTIAQEAGTKLDFAWKVQWDKNANTVTTDRLPYADGVFTQEQVAQFQTETSNTVAQLQAQIQAIDARVAADVQAKLAQVPANPPKPELMSTKWNHGDGSGEPTKSAERIGGSTAAGAAGGAAFGAAAGDAGVGAGIGAGVGLLGGFIYDTVSKNNDREKYERKAEAENDERISEWHSQIKALDKQRDQVKKDGATEKQQMLSDLANKIAAANGHLDQLPAPSDTPQAPPAYSDAPQVQPSTDQPSGPIK